jgi:hypothetical protein
MVIGRPVTSFAAATFPCADGKEDFIFSFERFCRPRPRKAAGILGFLKATRNVGFVAFVALAGAE